MSKERKVARVVIDTNILVSGILVELGMPNALLRSWQDGHVHLLTAPPLITEVARTLQKPRIRRKYQLVDADIDELIESLHAAEQVTPLPYEQLPLVSRDINDNPFLAVALAGNADYLITGDKDLLDLRDNPALATLQIVTRKSSSKARQPGASNHTDGGTGACLLRRPYRRAPDALTLT